MQLPTGASISPSFDICSTYDGEIWNVILLSSDAVCFCVRHNRLLRASKNSFNSLLLPYLITDGFFTITPPYISVLENSAVLEVVLRVMYDLPIAECAPTLGALLEAVQALHKYGVPLHTYVIPGKPLFEDLVLKTPYKPLDVYAVAAENGLFELACHASQHLLSLPLVCLSDGMIQRLGNGYLHMLYNLHLARMHVLQRLLTKAPEVHEPTTLCSQSNYQMLVAAWSVAVCELSSNASPGQSPFAPRTPGKTCILTA